VSGGQIFALAWLILAALVAVGLLAYLYLGPGSSRWYR